jgi:hypothetical protein
MNLNCAKRSYGRLMVSYVMVIVLLLTALSSASVAEAAPLPSNKVKTTWLWNTSLISTLESRNSILQFAKEQSVGRIYLQVNPDVAKSAYRAFNKAAANAGIQIHALDGAPNWVLPDNRQRIASLVTWVKDYNQSVVVKERFTGIQVDVEPYLLPEWQTDRDTTVMSWIETLTFFNNEVKKNSALTTSAALPFWLSQIAVPGNNSVMLNEKLISSLDEVTLMSYRDQAAALVEITAVDITVGDRLGKKIVVGVETNLTSEAAYISFYEEGKAAMDLQLSAIDDSLKSHLSYAGIAVHDYIGWRNLKP